MGLQCHNLHQYIQNPQTLFLNIFDLPDHSEGDQKLCKLVLNNFCGPKDSKKVYYVGLEYEVSLINMVGPSQSTVRGFVLN